MVGSKVDKVQARDKAKNMFRGSIVFIDLDPCRESLEKI